ncbi:MAG: hypothetical protein OSB46_17700 [Alphaproteobacteria bacterium]|nr:hypothetical protein [Alphaproteobacteria bacterium]
MSNPKIEKSMKNTLKLLGNVNEMLATNTSAIQFDVSKLDDDVRDVRDKVKGMQARLAFDQD